MAVSRVKEVVEQIKNLTIAEKIELLKTLLSEQILLADNDNFTDKEISEIESALQEVALGEWVDFDEYRKTQNI